MDTYLAIEGQLQLATVVQGQMQFLLLFFSLLTVSMGQSIIYTLMPSITRELGLSEFQLAFLLSFSALVSAIGAPMWGKYAMKNGRKKTLSIGLAGYCFGTLLFTTVMYGGLISFFATTVLFQIMLVTRLSQSSLMCATAPSAIGYLLATTPKQEQLTRTSRLISANSLGQISGPAVVSITVSFGLLAPLYLNVLFTFIAFILVMIHLQEIPLLPDKKTGALSEGVIPEETTDSIQIKHYAFVFIAASLFCVMSALQQTIGFYFIDHLHLPPQEAAIRVGYVSVSGAILTLLTQFVLLPKLRLPAAKLLNIGLVMLIIGIGLITQSKAVEHFIFAMTFVGLGIGFSYPSVVNLATDTDCSYLQGQLAGFISSAPALGFIAGPPIAAFLYVNAPRSPFWFALGLIVFSLILKAVINKTAQATNSKH